MQPDHVRRQPDGSIDYGFYRRRAVRLRSENIRKAARRMASMIKPLIAVALLLGTLLAMPTRAPQPANPAADVAAAAGGDAFRAN
jgi:hypothetical protein